jgi:hypothetical protein
MNDYLQYSAEEYNRRDLEYYEEVYANMESDDYVQYY